MLTRLEVDGFKNLLGFELDFGPFTCVAGPAQNHGVAEREVTKILRIVEQRHVEIEQRWRDHHRR